jgi:cell division protein ZapA (FtsZ GTPase activity inhibitor)
MKMKDYLNAKYEIAQVERSLEALNELANRVDKVHFLLAKSAQEYLQKRLRILSSRQVLFELTQKQQVEERMRNREVAGTKLLTARPQPGERQREAPRETFEDLPEDLPEDLGD